MTFTNVHEVENVAPVSVVIPCWRCSTTIERAVKSVAAQTLCPAEVLLIDDASGDTTLETLHHLAASYQKGWVKVLSLSQNAGPGGARNLGWENSKQDWLAFLDADDAWHPNKLEYQLQWLNGHQDAAMCGHDTVVAKDDQDYPLLPPKISGGRVTFLQMLISNRFPTRSVLIRRRLPYRFSGRHVTEDYLLWLEIMLDGRACYRIEAPLAVSFRGDSSPGGYSGQLWRHEKRELNAWLLLRRKNLISRFTTTIALTWSLIKYLRRRILR